MESWRKGGTSWGVGGEEVAEFSFYYIDGGHFEFFVALAVGVYRYDYFDVLGGSFG